MMTMVEATSIDLSDPVAAPGEVIAVEIETPEERLINMNYILKKKALTLPIIHFSTVRFLFIYRCACEIQIKMTRSVRVN